jgi:hypothetical protein
MKIEQLPDDLLRRYEQQVLADPKTTAKSARQWLFAEGCAVSLAAVLRHRRRLAEVERGRAHGAAVAAATLEFARRQGLTPADLAAGRALRARHQLLAQVSEAFFAVSRTKQPAPPEQILAFARAVRLSIG